MTRGEDKIKDLFSDKLKDFQPEIPASLWAGIEDSLSEQQIVAEPAKKRFSLRTVVSIVAAAAAIVGAIFVVDNMFEKPGDIANKEIAQVFDTPRIEDHAEDHKVTTEEQLAQNTTVKPARTHARTVKLSSAENDNVDVNANAASISGYTNSAKDEQTKIEIKDKSVTRQSDVEEESTRKITSDEAVNILKAQNNQMTDDQHRIEKKNKRRVDNFALGLSSSANVLSSSHSQRGATTFRMEPKTDEINLISLYSGENTSKMEHDQPVSFGLTVSKGIAPNLSVETGVVYTFLSSTIKTTGAYDMREKQKFHYLGVPLNLNYTFVRHKRFSSYVSVGAMIQKDIKGTHKGGLQNSKEKSGSMAEVLNTMEMSKSIKQDNPQLSVQTSVGVAYNLYKGLAIQARVGGAYYFDASNDYRTIYSDRDFQLDLNLGLKWEF